MLALIKRMKKNDSKFNAKALEKKGADTCLRETHGQNTEEDTC